MITVNKHFIHLSRYTIVFVSTQFTFIDLEYFDHKQKKLKHKQRSMFNLL